MTSFPLSKVVGTNRYLNSKLPIVHVILNALRKPHEPQISELSSDMEIPLRSAITLWIMSHIVPRGVLSQDTMIALISTFPDAFLQLGDNYAAYLERDEDLPWQIIAISDRRLVKLPGIDYWYDINRCMRIDHEPRTFEGITYNVARPVELEWQRIQMELKNEQSKDQGSPARPGNTGHCAVDSIGRPFGPGTPTVGSDDDPAGAEGEAGTGAGPEDG